MDVFSLDYNFSKRIYRDLIYFLILLGLAMACINPMIMMPPSIFFASFIFVIGIAEYKTGYISIAQSVCKIE